MDGIWCLLFKRQVFLGYEFLHELIPSWSWVRIYTLLLDFDQCSDEIDLVGIIVMNIPDFIPDYTVSMIFWCWVLDVDNFTSHVIRGCSTPYLWFDICWFKLTLRIFRRLPSQDWFLIYSVIEIELLWNWFRWYQWSCTSEFDNNYCLISFIGDLED